MASLTKRIFDPSNSEHAEALSEVDSYLGIEEKSEPSQPSHDEKILVSINERSDVDDKPGNSVIIPFFCWAPANGNMNLVRNNYWGSTKLRRLVFAPVKDVFLVGVRIGKNPQMMGDDILSTDCFPPVPHRHRRWANISGWDTFQVAMNIEITLENKGEAKFVSGFIEGKNFR